jgi:hypothetical protein
MQQQAIFWIHGYMVPIVTTFLLIGGAMFLFFENKIPLLVKLHFTRQRGKKRPTRRVPRPRDFHSIVRIASPYSDSHVPNEPFVSLRILLSHVPIKILPFPLADDFVQAHSLSVLKNIFCMSDSRDLEFDEPARSIHAISSFPCLGVRHLDIPDSDNKKLQFDASSSFSH